jgi:hypothetical protein
MNTSLVTPFRFTPPRHPTSSRPVPFRRSRSALLGSLPRFQACGAAAAEEQGQ